MRGPRTSRRALGLAVCVCIWAGASARDAAPPFELADWYLGLPVDEDGDGRADRIGETELAGGWTDPRFFFPSGDGGLTFRAPVRGSTTSANTRYVRTELREMLRRGDSSHAAQGTSRNNWALSTAPRRVRREMGGMDGELHAELRVDHVTTTGRPDQVGRVIIGQIHARDDEPVRLYYRKLPHHERGSLYFAHEVKGEPDDLYVPLLGDRANDAPDPADGIPLGERFGYSIVAAGDLLEVSILRDGRPVARKRLDMSDSGYDARDEYLYFKAGVYNQNNSGADDDYVQATFFRLDNLHARPK